MVKNYIYTAGVALMLLCTSCEDLKFGEDFLDKPLTTDIDIEQVFSERKYAEQVLNEAYHSLPDFQAADGKFQWNTLEILTDLGDCHSGSVYYTGQVSSATASSLPYVLDNLNGVKVSGPISGIRQAYIYIENVDRVPDMTPEEKRKRKAEAKMIIAYHYADMLRYYGGCPWIDHAYTVNDDLTFGRMTVEEHVNRIVQLCDEAFTFLPWSVASADEGRMCGAAALALKNRVLHFAASPLFNSAEPFKAGEASDKRYTWYGNYDKNRWQTALDAGLQFLRVNHDNGDYFKMVNTGNPRKDFLSGYYDRGSMETIIASHRYNKVDNIWRRWLCQIRWARTIPSALYGDMFETVEGEKFDWEKHGDYPFWDENGNPTRDARLYETLWVNGDSYRGRKIEIYQGGRETWEGNGEMQSMENGAYNGYGLRKFALDQGTELFSRYYQCPLLRLPEVYLNIAEAMNELGLADTPDEFGRTAYDYVNLVRNRAGLPDLDKAEYPAGEKLLEAILHERAVEFGFEEVRYFDINRRKLAQKYLVAKEKDRFRLKTYKDASKPDGFRYERTNDMKAQRVWVNRWDDKYYLIPFAVEEINKKYGLVQNPGWE